jgi:uncharacterized membrane protein HdeD (DUF308 family)
MTSDAHDRGNFRGAVERRSQVVRVFAGIWWLMVLRGIAAIVLGLIAVFAPTDTVLALLLFLGIYLIVDGVFGLVSSVMAGRRQERWGLLVAESLFNILVGAILLLEPGIGLVVFMLLLAAWAIVTGALMIGTAMNHKRDGKGWLVGGGLISVVFGILLAVAPVIGAVVLTWWLGVYALMFGVALVIFGFRLRSIAA